MILETAPFTTDDQSPSLYSNRFGEAYHSHFGALTESRKVFIENGLQFCLPDKAYIRIFEVGFGTGFNALLSCQNACNEHVIHYTAIELYPIKASDIQWLIKGLPDQADLMLQLHAAGWGIDSAISPFFCLNKVHDDLLAYQPKIERFDLIYFDAFSPDAQPELWTVEMMQKMFNALAPGGVLVTYSSKGLVKSALREVGFWLKRLSGPPGKRHVLRAVKPMTEY